MVFLLRQLLFLRQDSHRLCIEAALLRLELPSIRDHWRETGRVHNDDSIIDKFKINQGSTFLILSMAFLTDALADSGGLPCDIGSTEPSQARFTSLRRRLVQAASLWCGSWAWEEAPKFLIWLSASKPWIAMMLVPSSSSFSLHLDSTDKVSSACFATSSLWAKPFLPNLTSACHNLIA